MANEEINENEEQINPYLEPLEELREKFYQLLDELQVFPNNNIVDWNRNVDLYWKWENEEPIPDTPDPDPEGDDDLPVNIVVSRNEVIKTVRNLKTEKIEADRQAAISAGQIINDWNAWQKEEEKKYSCLKDAEDRIKALKEATLTEEWTLCSDSLPLSYMQVLTTDNNGIVQINSLDSNNEWSSESEIIAWIDLPSPYSSN